MIAEALAGALERAATALEAGDAPGAAAAMGEASRACQEAEARGERVAPAALAELTALHARCGQSAARARATLEQALESAGAARRAVSAYRRP
ncbi:hypothetical protein [Anaeromyxobacter diazotrophicus]|uniref:Uncharacterized protein n=1 Tax=Anaeromyxobacter diazotrophicus TaxID=2590199 RepID=A0A7I9VSR7_9BACT|nr:hypothetical protein [Anaeromyxobacter diazotrophicus]GEJ59170.1 hypothetical protein AMYX_39110 [Anaeromyxobacter diazotrophicus]